MCFRYQPVAIFLLIGYPLQRLVLIDYAYTSFMSCYCVQGVGSFLADMSVLDVESDLDWNPAIKSINSSPFSFYDDGGVVYYKLVQ